MGNSQEQSILETLLFRLDSSDENLELVTIQEIDSWPTGLFDTLCREGLLAPTAPSSLFTCTQCNDPHSEEIIQVESPPGSEPRLYIQCPSVGRIRVYPEELRQWILVPEGWAKLAGRLLGISGHSQADIPGRVWRMGVGNLGRVNREVLLVRGLSWVDGQSVETRIAGVTNSTPPALVLPQELPNSSLLCPIPLPKVLRFVDGEFLLDRTMLDFITASWPTVAPAYTRTKVADDFHMSEDSRTAVLHGVSYVLTPRQAQVVDVLYENYKQGMPELSQERILDRIGSESDKLTLRDIFRNSDAWNTLIVSGSRRGMYRLNI